MKKEVASGEQLANYFKARSYLVLYLIYVVNVWVTDPIFNDLHPSPWRREHPCQHYYQQAISASRLVYSTGSLGCQIRPKRNVKRDALNWQQKTLLFARCLGPSTDSLELKTPVQLTHNLSGIHYRLKAMGNSDNSHVWRQLVPQGRLNYTIGLAVLKMIS